MTENLLEKAADIAKKKHGVRGGFGILARACDVSDSTVKEWARAGRLPLSCLAYLRDYHKKIAKAVDYEITSIQLLEWSRASWKAYYAGTSE